MPPPHPPARRREADSPPTTCAPCRGTGRVLAQVEGALEPRTCPWCDGTGVPKRRESDAEDATEAP